MRWRGGGVGGLGVVVVAVWGNVVRLGNTEYTMMGR